MDRRNNTGRENDSWKKHLDMIYIFFLFFFLTCAIYVLRIMALKVLGYMAFEVSMYANSK